MENYEKSFLVTEIINRLPDEKLKPKKRKEMLFCHVTEINLSQSTKLKMFTAVQLN